MFLYLSHQIIMAMKAQILFEYPLKLQHANPQSPFFCVGLWQCALASNMCLGYV